MPRSSTGKKRTPVPSAAMEGAVRSVISGQMKFSDALTEYGVCRTTLRRQLQKWKASQNTDVNSYEYAPKLDVKRVFTHSEEAALVKYAVDICHMQYGLTLKGFRVLAYKYAIAKGKPVPTTWETEERASEEWLRSFRSRNPGLSLRKPEPTSLSRSTSFNKHTVGLFFENLMRAHEKYGPFSPDRIFNMDETALTTVQKPEKILAPTGQKQVGKATSQERGTLVTMIGCISASGYPVPPLLVFPRVNFKPFMLTGAPPCSVGEANPSGWSNGRIFTVWLKHFIEFTHASTNNRVLLTLDNHESHLACDAIELARNNGVVMLTLPPHTSNKTQPLDRTVYGPLTHYYDQGVDIWMANHPGRTFSIYDISSIVGNIYSLAFSTGNILSGFRCTGIYPLNPHIFPDSAFLCSSVTDRPMPQPDGESSTSTTGGTEGVLISPETCATPGSSDATSTTGGTDGVSISPETCATPESSDASTRRVSISPEDVCPFPKAEARKNTRKGRKPGATKIVTETPEKIVEKENQTQTPQKTKQTTTQTAISAKKPKFNVDVERDSDSDHSFTSGSSDSKFVSTSEDDADTDSEELYSAVGEILILDFVIVRLLYDGKKGKISKLFLAQVISIDEANVSAKFLRHMAQRNSFHFPQIDDIMTVKREDIVFVLTKNGVSHRRGYYTIHDRSTAVSVLLSE